jgi:signal transduction histidine kinase
MVVKLFFERIWKAMDGSMRARILFPTTILFAMTLTLMVTAAVQMYGTEIAKSARERVELTSNIVVDGVVSAISNGDMGALPEMLESVKAHRSDIDSIAYMDTEGVATFALPAGLVGRKLREPESLSPGVLEARGTPGQFVALRPVITDACPGCALAPKTVGWLELRFSRSQEWEAKRRLAWTLAWAAAPSLAILLGIAWWLLGREGIHPLKRLVKTMRAAEAGDLQVLADEGRPDELGTAARGFDRVLSALRKSQAELEAVYRERMERADRFALVGEMATGLAHEIKNPLAGLSGALELLAEDLHSSERHGAVVNEMQAQVTRLTRIMESLLSFARPPKPHLQWVDVNPLVEKVLFLIEQQRRGKARLTVDRALSPNLPPVHADLGQLQQVFLNIFLNASQAMNGQGGTITVRSLVKDGAVTVEVADTGPGIPVEARPHVFKPFFTTRRDGNGLGLSISERIISEHGGRISFSCPPGGGTTFVVMLPAGTQQEVAA